MQNTDDQYIGWGRTDRYDIVLKCAFHHTTCDACNFVQQGKIFKFTIIRIISRSQGWPRPHWGKYNEIVNTHGFGINWIIMPNNWTFCF